MRNIAGLVAVVLVCAYPAAVKAASLDEARALVQTRQFDEAERIYRTLLRSEDRATISAELAALYEQLGEIDAAVTMYEQAVAAGGFEKHEAQRLDSRLQKCRRQRASTIRFPVSVEAESELRQVEAALRARQWTLAYGKLASLFERFTGAFLQRGPGQYMGIRQWAAETLAELPEPARTAYEDYSSDAWSKAIEDGSDQAFRGYLLRHPGEPLERQGFETWADVLTIRGDINLASALHDRFTQTPEAPAAHDELIINQQRHQLHAIDPTTGKTAWRYAFVEPSHRQNVKHDIYGRPRMPRHAWADAFDEPQPVVCPAGVLAVDTFHLGDRERVRSVLVCIDASSGTPRWRTDDDPELATLRVTGNPVYTGGLVLFVGATHGDFPVYWIYALRAGNGSIVWKYRVAVAALPTQCIGRGMLPAGQSGPVLTATGSTVYYATHMGAVIAMDRDLGEPIWAVTYPRIARFGPPTTFDLPLLERRTSAMQATDRFLVLLPRDANSLFVIDHTRGQLHHTIRSLELDALVGVRDGLAVVTTSSNHVRAYNLDTGALAWSWPAPTTLDKVIPDTDGWVVWHAGKQTRLDAQTGQATPLDEQSTDTAADVPSEVDAPPVVVDTAGQMTGDWRLSAIAPGRAMDSLLTGATSTPIWLLADHRRVYAMPCDQPDRVLWTTPFDSRVGLWAATTESSAPEHRPAVVVSEDRRSLRFIDANEGVVKATLDASALAPVRELLIADRRLLIRGSSGLRCVSLAADLAKQPTVLWTISFDPHGIEHVEFTGDVLHALVQSALDAPARVVTLDPASGDELFNHPIRSPRPTLENRYSRDESLMFPIDHLTFTPADLQRNDDDLFVHVSDRDKQLHTSPVRFLGLINEHEWAIELSDYYGMIHLETGETTLATKDWWMGKNSDKAEPFARFAAWIRSHQSHFNHSRPQFQFRMPGLNYRTRGCSWLGRSHQGCSELVVAGGQHFSIGGIEPKRSSHTEDFVTLSGDGGAVLATRRPIAEPTSSHGTDLLAAFSPTPIATMSHDGLTLDGDVRDWPADGWHTMSPKTHSWTNMAMPGGLPNETCIVQFATAVDDDAFWLAVRVADSDHQSANASPGFMGDQIAVVFFCEALEKRWPPPQAGPAGFIRLNMALTGNVSTGHITADRQPNRIARTPAPPELFDLWWSRHYGTSPLINEQFVFAVQRSATHTTYELRVERTALNGGKPWFGDLRVTDVDEGGRQTVLAWCGTLMDHDVFPPAPFTFGGNAK